MKNLYIYLVVLATFTMLSACKKDNESTMFYWDETGCSDPWKQDSDDTEEERKTSIDNYLADQNVSIQNIKFEFDSTKVQLCKACGCLTGRVVLVKVSWTDKRKMKKLDFYQK